MTDGDRTAAARAMKALSDTDREEAIRSAASQNVVGFERFTEKAKQVALSRGYRRPGNGKGGVA